MKNLLKSLTEKLGKDELDDSLERFEDFDSFQRSNDMTIIEFITNFDRKYQRLARGSMTIPSPILAFMMLKKAGISADDKKLVLSGMDYSKKDTLYEQAKKSLRKFKGDHCYGSGSISGSSNGSSVAIKVEPAYYTQSEHGQSSEVFFTGGRYRGNIRGYRGKALRGCQWQSTVGSIRNGKGGKLESHCINRYQSASQSYRGASRARKVNPKGPDGNILLCNACGSFRHMVADYPDSYENMSRSRYANCVREEDIENALFTMAHDQEDVVLLTGFNKESRNTFSREAKNCAVLDSACTSTVCSAQWLEDYLASISESQRKRVKNANSGKIFKFGGGERLQSAGEFQIPAN